MVAGRAVLIVTYLAVSGRVAFGGDLFRDLPQLLLAQARDGEHPVAVREQLGHAAGTVRHRRDRLAELQGTRGDGGREGTDAVPGDDVRSRSPGCQRPGGRDAGNEQGQLGRDGLGQGCGRVERADSARDQPSGFGERLIDFGDTWQVRQHPRPLCSLAGVHERHSHVPVSAHGSTQSRGPAQVRTSAGPSWRRSSR